MDQMLNVGVAARTFGSWPPARLEDVSSIAAAAELVETACPPLPRDRADLLALDAGIGAGLRPLQYQTGRRRFRGQGSAGRRIVTKAVAETTATMRDPKANFLAWYRRVRQSSEVHFDLPAALDVALEGLPPETFAVAAPPLQCKLRLRKELPENLRRPWQTGLPDYETLSAEAQRRLAAYGADDACGP